MENNESLLNKQVKSNNKESEGSNMAERNHSKKTDNYKVKSKIKQTNTVLSEPAVDYYPTKPNLTILPEIKPKQTAKVLLLFDENKVDVKENWLLKFDSQLLTILLQNHSTKQNIIWATNNYSTYGAEYEFGAPIFPELITGKNGNIIKPRVNKNKAEQQTRVREKAEVFTPSWICNAQNNLVDNAWFGRENVFNTETVKGWISNKEKIIFDETGDKTWQHYVYNNCLEVACGEAPYLVSRYDTITGLAIPIEERIGLLDRKLRVVAENTSTKQEWLEWALIAFKRTYGFEWQGDNLMLARENLLYTFMDYYQTKFDELPTVEDSRQIAEIISWNIWQMDGLKGVVPNTCKTIKSVKTDLFGNETETIQKCKGCEKNDMKNHNGTYCIIKDWFYENPETKEVGAEIRFVDMLKK